MFVFKVWERIKDIEKMLLCLISKYPSNFPIRKRKKRENGHKKHASISAFKILIDNRTRKEKICFLFDII